MEQVRLWADSLSWVGGRLPCSTLPLFDGNGFYIHGAETSDQERGAKALAIDLAIYLVGRLVDSKSLKQSRELFVTDATSHHLDFYQLLRRLLPALIRLSLLATLARQSAHHFPAFLKSPLVNLHGHFLTTIFSRIRPTHKTAHYTFSTGHFFEDKLLSRTSTAHTAIELASPGGAK